MHMTLRLDMIHDRFAVSMNLSFFSKYRHGGPASSISAKEEATTCSKQSPARGTCCAAKNLRLQKLSTQIYDRDTKVKGVYRMICIICTGKYV